jgi:hypothetical protein
MCRWHSGCNFKVPPDHLILDRAQILDNRDFWGTLFLLMFRTWRLKTSETWQLRMCVVITFNIIIFTNSAAVEKISVNWLDEVSNVGPRRWGVPNLRRMTPSSSRLLAAPLPHRTKRLWPLAHAPRRMQLIGEGRSNFGVDELWAPQSIVQH